MDYRKLNIKKNGFPLPQMDDTLDTLTGAKWFSTLDLKSSYWQADLHPDNKKNCVLDGSRAMVVHSHALWPL
jgi:hypothetical protein